MSNGSLADRFNQLHANRQAKLYRSRLCASLTIPSLLPPEGWNEEQILPQPYSSIGGRGVTALASRMLSAMIPVNDSPFFRFILKNGAEPTNEIKQFLETLSYQVYQKLTTTNLRETVYQSIQSLIVVGDSLVHLDDEFKFRTTRLDNYVVQRAVSGEIIEIIFIEYDLKPIQDNGYLSPYSEKKGYAKRFCQLCRNKKGHWDYRKEDDEGIEMDKGVYEVCPVTPLRWYGMSGENYGRSHVEDTLGDLQSLDAFTKATLDGMAAASAFWLCLDPSGITEIDDVSSAENGSWIPARKEDIFVLSPSHTINPQLAASQTSVERMRQEIGQAFLMSSASIPTGDRVTATAVRMIGSELETVLGGAFSAIARELMEPIIKRIIFLMIEADQLDKRMYDQFFDAEGTLTVEVVTGLQALSRDTDLQKLIQMGEMVRNLPPEALATFKWEEYAKALISSLGFDARNWVITEEEKAAKQQEAMQQQQALQQQQMQSEAIGQVAAETGTMAAQRDLIENNGEGISNLLQGMPL